MYNIEYMKLAISKAKEGIGKGEGGPFGAVIVKNGEILAIANNTVVATNDPTAHGEVNAIRMACKKLNSFELNGCELYTTAKPCPMCLSAIMWARIKIVYYGCELEDTANIGFSDSEIFDYITGKVYAKKLVVQSQNSRKECLELFDEYKKIEDKTMY